MSNPDIVPLEAREYMDIQNYLYQEKEFSKRIWEDYDLFANEIIHFLTIRPLLLEKILNFCILYDDDSEFSKNFRNSLLYQTMKKQPVLAFHLFHGGLYSTREIIESLKKTKLVLSSYYFKSIISNFEEFNADFLVCDDLIDTMRYYIVEDEIIIEDLINNGFYHESIEYCLKYDDHDSLKRFIENPSFVYHPKWSCFEWSKKPKETSLISLSAHFGSLKSFKFLFTIGFQIDDYTKKSSIFGGNNEIFSICHNNLDITQRDLEYASKFCRNDIVDWILEKNIQLNERLLYHNNYHTIILALSKGINVKKKTVKDIFNVNCVHQSYQLLRKVISELLNCFKEWV